MELVVLVEGEGKGGDGGRDGKVSAKMGEGEGGEEVEGKG